MAKKFQFLEELNKLSIVIANLITPFKSNL